MQVKLSDGTKVTLKESWSHGTQKAWELALFAESKEVTAKGLHAAWEAVFVRVIENIEKGTETITYSIDWLDSLKESDYKALRTAADGIDADADEKSKKNP